MAHIRQRLTPAVEKGAERVERMALEIEETAGGHETINQLWSQFLCQFDVSWPIGQRSSATIAEITAAFRATGGGAHSFDFRDWREHEATDAILGLGDGTSTVFPLIITDTFGTGTYARRIYLPEVASFALKLDGVAVAGADYTLDSDLGIVTFYTAPGVGVVPTWSGNYDKPVRFDREMRSKAVAIALEKIEGVTLFEKRLQDA